MWPFSGTTAEPASHHSAQYGRTARSFFALLSPTAPFPPRLTIHCCPCCREGGLSVTLPYRGPLNGYASPPNVLLLSISAEHAPGDATYPTAYAPFFPAQGDLWWRAQRRPPRDRCEIRVTRLGFGIRASGVEIRASPTRAAAEHAPGDATCPRVRALSSPTQDGPWWRTQRRPPRDCREVRVTGLEARVRNPSRPASKTRALPTRAAAEHAPGDATCPRAHAPSLSAQGGLWCRAQRRPPRDCREITGSRGWRLGFRIRAGRRGHSLERRRNRGLAGAVASGRGSTHEQATAPAQEPAGFRSSARAFQRRSCPPRRRAPLNDPFDGHSLE